MGPSRLDDEEASPLTAQVIVIGAAPQPQPPMLYPFSYESYEIRRP